MMPVTPASPSNLCHTEPTGRRPRSVMIRSSKDRIVTSSLSNSERHPAASTSHSVPTIILIRPKKLYDFQRRKVLCHRTRRGYNAKYRMSRKTIAKLSGFVICLALAAGCFLACSHASSSEKPAAETQDFQKPKIVGRMQNKDIIESSGIAASYCQTGVYWTHNDSGDGPFIFAIDETGKDLGKWRVVDARNTDWEDIAASKDASGKCYLYLGEIGNNKLERSEA